MICVDLCLCKCMVVSELCNFAMSEIRFIGIILTAQWEKYHICVFCLFVCLFFDNQAIAGNVYLLLKDH